jgi:CheY-like chemotaxis protein
MSPLILYIEDQPDNTLLGVRVLESLGYRALMAPNGQAGLALAEAHHPALILLDINLPDMDGYTVARRLRTLPGFETTPIIAVSANALREDMAQAYEAGCNAYITKPISLPTLRDQIKALLPA